VIETGFLAAFKTRLNRILKGEIVETVGYRMKDGPVLCSISNP
jgi:hypothetical protein